MNSSNPQIEHLKQMLRLEEQRANLQQQLNALDAHLDSLKRQLVGGAAAATTKLAPAATGTKSSKKAAKQNKPAKAAKAAPAKPSASKAPAGKKAKGNARGQLLARILTSLKAAGSSGVTIKTLAEKFKMPYRNVQVWFATTGKKNPSIKKIAPATYRFVG